MCESLAHRGPDGSGYHYDRNAALGHRRLSIIDLAGGRQPMANEDGTLHVVFNGEIYNHAELRAELQARGHRFDTRSDTEPILHLYEEYGARCVDRLRGMFALAIWDGPRQELFLARDRLGIKPLYYLHAPDGTFYFGSEIKAVLAAGVGAELNEAVLPDHLANRAVTDEQTLFRGVRRLAPGHHLTLRDGAVVVRPYWDLPMAGADAGGANGADVPAESADDGALVARWGELFEDAVRSHLMSDVPLGVFLSGGLDSSAIAAVMARSGYGPVRTFAVGFEEPEANELGYARLAARALGTEHHEAVLSAGGFADALATVLDHSGRWGGAGAGPTPWGATRSPPC